MGDGAWRAVAVAALLTLGACGVRADHERRGDRRYAEGAYVDALAEYRLAARQRRASLELRAKLGAASLHAGALGEAAAAYQDLAAADATALNDAVEGLVRTARAAALGRDVAALRQVTAALERLAPHRLAEALGPSLAVALGDVRSRERVDLLLAAAGRHPAAADSLVATWAELASGTGRCEEAMAAWTGLQQRPREAALARRARAGIATCRIEEGRELLAAGALEEAEAAFHDATQTGVPDSLSRLAWVLIGDARWATGDSALAVEAYRKAAERGDEDHPTVQRALAQLRRLTGNPDLP